MLKRMLKLFKKEKKGTKDYSLSSGERQIADKVEEIREDHLARYRLVQNYIDKLNCKDPLNCLDIFCGNGYGSYMLSRNNPNLTVKGIDGSEEAIDLADRVYKLNNNSFVHKLFPFKLEKSVYDLIICFESLEHVEEDKKMFQEMVTSAKLGAFIFVSVPNDNCHSLEKNPHIFHYRHYMHGEFLENFQDNLELINWYGQNVYEFEDGICQFKLLSNENMQPRNNIEGQVNIYLFKKV